MTEPENPSSASPSERVYRLRQPIGESRKTVTVSMPKGWARAALSGVEAALLGWAVPALLAILGLLAEGTNPWMRGVEISEAAAIGTDFWALSFGAPVVVGGLPISLMPLLWTIAQVLILRGLLVGGKTRNTAGLWAAIPFFMLTAVFIVAAAPGTTGIAPMLLGAFAVSFLAVLWAALARSEDYPAWFARLAWAWSGIRTGSWWLLATAATGLVTLLIAALQVRPEMAATSEAVGATGFSGVLFALVQIAYVPVLAAWALAWLSGAGFTIAVGDLYTPSTVVDSSLPLFPIAEMVPTTAVGSQIIWIPIGVGIILGALTSWQLRRLPYLDMARRVLVALLFFSFLIGVWMVLSGGALGAERMLGLGPESTAWPLLVAEFAGPAIAVALLTHPESLGTMRTWLNTGAAAVKERVQKPTPSEEARDAGETSAPHAESAAPGSDLSADVESDPDPDPETPEADSDEGDESEAPDHSAEKTQDAPNGEEQAQ